MKKIKIERLSDTEIAQMFSDYVTRMEDKPRHTKAAIKEADAFDTFLESEFPRNIRLQVNLYNKMMNCAVEYEESGFIAGFKTAIALVFGNDNLYQTSLKESEKVENKQEQKKEVYSNNISTKLEKMEHEIVNASQMISKAHVVNDKYISTRQIAEMFGSSNWKIVQRIEKYIIPECTEVERKGFYRCFEKNEQRRDTDVYRLNYKACLRYCQYMSHSKKFQNVKIGIEQMKDKMTEVFCGCCTV